MEALLLQRRQTIKETANRLQQLSCKNCLYLCPFVIRPVACENYSINFKTIITVIFVDSTDAQGEISTSETETQR